MKVLLSALVAVTLVSPALAATSTRDSLPAPTSERASICVNEVGVLEGSPEGAKIVKTLSPSETRNFIENTKIDAAGIDGITVYSSPKAEERGVSIFFTFTHGCVIGTGAFDKSKLPSLIVPAA